MVLKGLEFRLNPPNPLTYVEILLEVLGKIIFEHRATYVNLYIHIYSLNGCTNFKLS